MKLAVGIIVFNSDFVLKQVLDSMYDHADQILIAEGPVDWWHKKTGLRTSNDGTNTILANYPDPDKKITIVRGPYAEKTEQANAYMAHLWPDMDYIWNIDADEVFKQKDIIKVKELLADKTYTSVGFRSITFFGGFNHYLTGFEQEHQFMRIRRVYPGSVWADHRPPTIKHAPGVAQAPEKHLDYDTLASLGIYMYHYSYTFPRQVFEKIQYYEGAVISPGNCIPNYFNEVWMHWVNHPESRPAIEKLWQGVHEFMPRARGECFTAPFTGQHPKVILDAMPQLKAKFKYQLERYRNEL